MIETVFGQILSFFAMVVLGNVFSRIAQITPALGCLLSGVLVGVALSYGQWDLGFRAEHVQSLVHYLFVPILLFNAGSARSVRSVELWLTKGVLLASFGALLSFSVVFAVLYWQVRHPVGLPWLMIALTGVMLMATEPSLAVAVLKQNKAPLGIGTLLEIESLLSGTLAVVLFSVLLALLQETQTSTVWFMWLWHVCWLIGGAVIIGGWLGKLGATLRQCSPCSEHHLALELLLAFGSYWLAEQWLGISGALTVVCAAFRYRAVMSSKVVGFQSHTLLSELGKLLDLMLFCLMGLLVTFDMFVERYWTMCWAILAALLGRGLAIWACQRVQMWRKRPFAKGWPVLLWWGGQHGAIALALVLLLPISLPGWWTVQAMIFAVVLFSQIVQGGTLSKLYRHLLHAYA